ncbi:Myb-DNA-bind-2 domain-containing protein [Mycena indigotica]|uniref:Myb-DNA-bind-2 domain-containing protein n=1 Tax=Mycena indigotica TaxID=2126181 RepID=A0A8H6STP5_9AGAR|nr:Myb-DNA-bind-2 domain-containing protein [Mycena indigotica]KAF7304182.1 Myb-DNA-bind-2 domain-containing protein [Mycena indigotica]
MQTRHSLPAACKLFPLILSLAAVARGQNTSFDDTHSSFSWYGEWRANNGDCSACATKLDQSKVYGGTWHDGSYVSGKAEQTGGSFSFTGTGVYIYGVDQPTSGPDIVFTLDGVSATHYYTSSVNAKVYGALFYSRTGLSNGPHTVNFVLKVDAHTTSDQVVALFDYAVVTTAAAQSGGGGGNTGGSGGGGTTGGGGGTTIGGGTTTGGNGAGSTSSGGTTGNNGDSNSANPNSPSNPVAPVSNNPSSAPAKTGSSSPTQSPKAIGAGAAGQTFSTTVTIAGANSTSRPPPTSPATSKHSSVAAGVGAALGAAALIAMLIAAFCFWRRRKARHPHVSVFPVAAATKAMEEARPSGASLPRIPEDAAPSMNEKSDPFWTAAGVLPSVNHQHDAPERDDSPVRFASNSNSPVDPDLDLGPPPTVSRSPSVIVSVTSRGRSAQTTSSMRERERVLEARVAELEARIGTLGTVLVAEDAQPPPYVRRSQEVAPSRSLLSS